MKDVGDTFENREAIEDNLKDLGDDVYYHGSDDISYLSSKEDFNTVSNTKNAESKYVNLTPKAGTAVSYSIRQQRIGEKSGVAAFKLKGKGYTMTNADIKTLKSNADYEAFYDKKKSEGYDFVKVPQDANDIVVLNNNAIEYVGKKFNKDALTKAPTQYTEAATPKPEIKNESTTENTKGSPESNEPVKAEEKLTPETEVSGIGGGEPPKEPIEPINVEDDLGNIGRRFTQQMLRTDDLTPEAKAEIAKTLEYVEQTNAMSAAEAESTINKVGVDEAFNLVMDRNNNMNGGVRTTMAQAIIKNYNEQAKKATDEATKNYYLDKTIQTATFVTEKLATDAGQSIQAFSMWEKLSPEGQLRAAVKDVAKQTPVKKNEARKNVDKVGDKMQKANEETANEITKGDTVKKATAKTESKLSKKGKDKIAKAKESREKIIKKYKSDKGKNLYAGVGLTNEGIEFVGNIVKTYIDEGVGNLQVITDKVLQHLKEISAKPITADVKSHIDEIAKTYLQKAGDIKIAKGLKELEAEISDIVRKHYTVKEDAKKSLTDKFIEKLGLEKDEAAELSKEIQSEFDRIATRKKQDILDSEIRRLNNIKKNLQGGKKADRKQIQDEIIKYSNLGAFDNGKLLDVIGEKLGLGEVSKEDAAKIIELSEKIQNAPEGSPKRNATEELLKYRANMKGTNWGEVAQGVWYANVLSGYGTHLKNIVSTFFNTMSFFGVEAIRNPKSIPVLWTGLNTGLIRIGVNEAAHTIRTGQTPIHVSKIETPDVLERVTFKGGFLNPYNYLKYVGRLMKAEDVLLFQGLKEMRATQLAYREANKMGLYLKLFNKNNNKQVWNKVNELLLNTKERYEQSLKELEPEKLSGLELKRRVYELMELSRPIQMTEDAYGFAAKGTFNHETEGTLGALTDAVSRSLDNSLEVGGMKPLRFVVPFTKIITNVANNALDFSPLGLVRAATGRRGLLATEASGKRRQMTKEERQQTLVKASLGISSMAALYAMSANGLVQVTGAGPSDLKKRLQLMESGWQPYSIKVGGKYISYKLTPFVFAWGLVGSIRDHEQYDKDADEQSILDRTALAGWDGVQLLSDMTWVGSAAPLMKAMASDNDGEVKSLLNNSVTQMAKSFVIPNFYTQAAQKVEEYFSIPQKKVHNVFESLIQDIPIARNYLDDKINALGDPVVKDVDIMTSKEKSDPVWQYLTEKKGWVAPVNQNTIIVFDDETKKDRPINDDEYYEFSKLRGGKIKKELEKLIQYGATVLRGGQQTHKTSSELTSAELNKVIREISTQATKETKKELFAPSPKKKSFKIKISEGASSDY